MNEEMNVDVVVNETAEAKETRTNITPKRFMQVWEEVVSELKSGSIEGSGVQLVADRLGLKKASVQQKVTTFRNKYGIKLATMPRGGYSRIDKDALQAELEEIRSKLAE